MCFPSLDCMAGKVTWDEGFIESKAHARTECIQDYVIDIHRSRVPEKPQQELNRLNTERQQERKQQHASQPQESIADERQQNAQRHKEGDVTKRVSQTESGDVWMLIRILAKARERIAQWSCVYVIRTRVPKTGDAGGNDREGEDDADVDD
jgi:hypothetical protein